ncbi:MAG: hypothetical protein Kapaf2KO_06520 [Candidatus Kapaibacteriales bacterium]
MKKRLLIKTLFVGIIAASLSVLSGCHIFTIKASETGYTGPEKPDMTRNTAEGTSRLFYGELMRENFYAASRFIVVEERSYYGLEKFGDGLKRHRELNYLVVLAKKFEKADIALLELEQEDEDATAEILTRRSDRLILTLKEFNNVWYVSDYKFIGYGSETNNTN